MNHKLFNMALIIILGITILGVTSFFLWEYTFAEPELVEEEFSESQLSSEEVEELSFDTEPITTNLYNQQFVVIQFNILANNTDAKEELLQREAEVKSTIISELASLTPEDLQGREGVDHLNAILMNRFNEFLQEGKVLRVLTIDRKIQ